MTMPRSIVFIAVLLVTVVGGVPARPADVDLSLVLAIDVSSSVNGERYELQMRGYAEAFCNPMVTDAIAQTPSGAIAVTLVQWPATGTMNRSLAGRLSTTPERQADSPIPSPKRRALWMGLHR